MPLKALVATIRSRVLTSESDTSIAGKLDINL